MEGAAPGKPFVARARGLVVEVLDAQLVQGEVQVADASIHLGGFVRADADVQQVVVLVQGLRIHFGIATVSRAAAGAAETSDPAEQFRMVQADGIGLETAQGQAADGAVVAVRERAEAGVEGRDGLLDRHFLEGVEIEQVETACGLGAGEGRHGMLADDDHRLAGAFRDQVVHDVAHHALGGPAGLILAGPVHQVQHREAARRLGRVLRRQIDIAGALLPRQGGVVLFDADLAVRDVLLQVIIHSCLRNLDAAGPEARAEEQPAVRVRNPLPVHIQRVIVETGHKGFRLGFPDAVRALHHRIVLAAHVHGDGLGLGIIVAENGRQVRIDHRKRLAGLVRGRGRRLGEDADGFLLDQI